ncbi:GNAT family N-acetyltransferase [Brachybacterium sp. YJGR34]|uniref:GNAT family N-acetyltransferase n=1 Tax=Brachybacterium sp. YJGR34 TaxID=2059911 RepID=UPI001300762A|nr:GNAT family N-acetyltransferase [Brachybacterium sp. YJGR34]
MDTPTPGLVPTLAPASDADHDLLARLLQLYLHDLSPHTGDDVDERGAFHYAWLEAYRQEAGRHAVLLRVEGRPAGFALIRSGEVTQMAEFFVLGKYRGAGVGSRAAQELFAAFPGAWSVSQLATNTEATAFWRRTIPVPYEEHVHADGSVEQRFTIEAGTGAG